MLLAVGLIDTEVTVMSGDYCLCVLPEASGSAIDEPKIEPDCKPLKFYGATRALVMFSRFRDSGFN